MDSMTYTNNFIQSKAYPSLGGMLPPSPINFSGGVDSYAINQPQADGFYSNTNTTSYAPSAPQKKSFLEKHWWKLLLGAGAVAVGAIALKGKFFAKEKPVDFEKVQQNLAEIFRQKDMTKEQTEAMLKNYQEIYKIEDKNTFIEKLFHQVKKDYGYENVDIKLKITDVPIDGDAMKGAGKYSFSQGEMEILNTRPKEQIFATITHEFDHVRQEEFQYLTSIERTKQAWKERAEHFLKNKRTKSTGNATGKTTTMEEFGEEIEKNLTKRWSGRQKFAPDSDEYKLGEKYIESVKSYVNGNKNAYNADFNEQEAEKIGGLMEEVAVHIKNLAS